MTFFEPWIFLRWLGGAVAAVLMLRAAITSARVLKSWDVVRVTEGQLLLERRVELAATFVRVGAAALVMSLLLSILGADKLSHGIRGAMCAYGTFHSNEWGFPALETTLAAAVATALLAQLYAFDARVRGPELVRPLAAATLLVAPLAIADLAMQTKFLLGLDLSVVASCCSVQLDAVTAGQESTIEGPRVLVTWLAPALLVASAALGLLVARRPTRARVTVIGALAVATIPIAVAAAILEVGPHAFEAPQHHCPFCLFRSDVLGIGYVLFGALFVALSWSAGAGLAALFARGPLARAALPDFARDRLRKAALAWMLALVVSAIPVIRYAIVAHGAPLFR